MSKIAVLGAGAWGTALAASFAANHDVYLWARDAALLETIREQRINSRYLPGITLPPSLRLESDLARAVGSADLVLIATSTPGFAPTLKQAAAFGASTVLWACKGFDNTTQQLPHEIAEKTLLSSAKFGALSGPSFANEVALGLPAALTLASINTNFARDTANTLNSARLRIYSSTDLIGVELGGAVKNVMAIAAGISDGLQLGHNARAALITRGLAEMVRLGVAMGGKTETFMGLTGLGDLVLTATGNLSRNRTVGMHLAEGKSLDAILAHLGHVAEGVNSAETALTLAKRYDIDMPITEAVNAVLFHHADPKETVARLLSRESKAESY